MAGSATTVPHSIAARPRKSIYMVLGCTVFAATAQVLMKFGMAHALPRVSPADSSTWLPFALALATDVPLVLGFCAHSINALLLILALREGELSLLYPVIAL